MPQITGGAVSQRSAAILVVFGVLCGGVAQAGPTRQALDAAADAVYLDFARDGVVASPDEVRGKYQEACDLGYDLACRPERWHDADGLPSIELAGPIFDKSCSSQDPVACVVAGWAIESRPLATDLEREERHLHEQIEKRWVEVCDRDTGDVVDKCANQILFDVSQCCLTDCNRIR